MEFLQGPSSHEVRVSVALFLVKARQMEGGHRMIDQILSLAHEEENLAKEISRASEALDRIHLDITNDCVDCRVVKNLTTVEKSVNDIDGFLQSIAQSPWATGVTEPLVRVQEQVSIVSKTIQVIQ